MNDLVSVVTETQMAIPTHEAALLLAIITICLLFRLIKIGLVTAYLFVYRWGWLFFRATFGETQKGYFIAYSLLGLIILALAGIRMRPEKKPHGKRQVNIT